MSRICIRCRKEEGVVRFRKRAKENGTVYTPPRCKQCEYQYRKNKVGGIRGRIGNAKVLWCPNNEYPRNGYFNRGEFGDALRDGLWTLGMLVTIKEQRYAVCGDGIERRILKDMGYPLDVALPKQWLVEVNGRARA